MLAKFNNYITYFIPAFLLGKFIFAKDHFNHILLLKHLHLLMLDLLSN